MKTRWGDGEMGEEIVKINQNSLLILVNNCRKSIDIDPIRARSPNYQGKILIVGDV